MQANNEEMAKVFQEELRKNYGYAANEWSWFPEPMGHTWIVQLLRTYRNHLLSEFTTPAWYRANIWVLKLHMEIMESIKWGLEPNY